MRTGDADGTADRAIVDAVLLAMQDAEEIWGPDGADYVATMQAIADEAKRRIATYAHAT